MLSDRVIGVFGVSEEDWQRLNEKGLFPNRNDPKAVKKQQELLARRLSDNESVSQTYDNDELLFLGVMDLNELSKKSRLNAEIYMSIY